MIRGALKAKKIALCLSAILIGLALAEAFLSIAGYEPGFLDAGFDQGAAFDPYAPHAGFFIRPRGCIQGESRFLSSSRAS